MSLFSNIKTDDSVTQEVDRVGGSYLLDSGAYPFVIDMAYAEESKGGAMGINCVFKTSGGKTFKQIIYVTSGKEKGQKNYYEREGKKHYLPGFNVANNITLLSIGKELSDIETEEKVVKVYSFDQKKEVPQKKQVLVELLGQEITLGVIQFKEPHYQDSSKIITKNEIDKVFRTSDNMTAVEIRAEATEAAVYDAWVKVNTGVVRTKGNVSTTPTTQETPPKKSLFPSK